MVMAMTGLEPILQSITEDAGLLADRIKKETKESLRRIAEEAFRETEQIKAGFEKKITEEIEEIHSSKNAELADMEKIAIMNAKAQAVDAAAKEAARRIASLEDGEYLKFIKSLVKKAELDRDSRVLLNEKDKKRLPKNIFSPSVVADNAIDSLGGFKVLGKLADLDFTIEAIQDAKYNEICDAINGIYKREKEL